jgi:hypothetical protein
MPELDGVLELVKRHVLAAADQRFHRSLDYHVRSGAGASDGGAANHTGNFRFRDRSRPGTGPDSTRTSLAARAATS